MGAVETAALLQEVEHLERELTTLRARVDEDKSSFSALEQQIAALRPQLDRTQEEMRLQELRLDEKKAQLAEAKRLERLAAYEQDLERLAEVRERAVRAGETYLSELDTYDGEVLRLRKLLEEMRAAFGDDERTAAVDTAMKGETEELGPTWSAVVDATKWRLGRAEPAAAASEVDSASSNGDDIADDLKKRAEERRTSRIREYFKN
jgi:phage-related tail protein